MIKDTTNPTNGNDYDIENNGDELVVNLAHRQMMENGVTESLMFRNVERVYPKLIEDNIDNSLAFISRSYPYIFHLW
jgi:hypothetical protein